MRAALKIVLDFGWAAGFSSAAIRACYLAVFAAVLAFALLQDEDYVYEGAPDRARWRDLRLWAASIMLLQAGIYLWF